VGEPVRSYGVQASRSSTVFTVEKINHGENRKGPLCPIASITEIWRTSSETLRASVAFPVRDRRYLTSLPDTRSGQITSTPEAHPRVTPPKAPVNCRRTCCRLPAMSGTEQLIPKLYREAAEQVRQLARDLGWQTSATICLNCRRALNDWALMPRPRSAAA
jgi:hypothetical protein